MITNFEKITYDLTSDELAMLHTLIRGFKAHGKDNPIKEPQIIAALKKKGSKLTGPRLRKLCNYIRSNSLIPLIATSKGYYTSYDREEIRRQVQSLYDRANAIVDSAEGLKKFIV